MTLVVWILLSSTAILIVASKEKKKNENEPFHETITRVTHNESQSVFIYPSNLRSLYSFYYANPL